MNDYTENTNAVNVYFDNIVITNSTFKGLTVSSPMIDLDGEEMTIGSKISFKNVRISDTDFSNICVNNAAFADFGSNVRLDFSKSTLKNVKFQNLGANGDYDVLVNNKNAISFSGATLDNVDFRSSSTLALQSLNLSAAASQKNVIVLGSGISGSTITNLELDSADDMLTIATHSLRNVKLSADAVFSNGVLEFVDKISSSDNAVLDLNGKTLTLSEEICINIYLSESFTDDLTFDVITNGKLLLSDINDIKDIIEVMDCNGNVISTSLWTATNDGSSLSISVSAIPEPAEFAFGLGILSLVYIASRKRK